MPSSSPISSVNDFVVRFANVNGSGSASANELFARSVMRMGIPVAPRNIFPSNIQGLPTWFTVRASKDGFIARRRDIGVLICMNPETANEDIRTVDPGAAVIYEEVQWPAAGSCSCSPRRPAPAKPRCRAVCSMPIPGSSCRSR